MGITYFRDKNCCLNANYFILCNPEGLIPEIIIKSCVFIEGSSLVKKLPSGFEIRNNFDVFNDYILYRILYTGKQNNTEGCLDATLRF